MSDLEKAREIINQVDVEMAKLFEKRMNAVVKVAEFKKAHGLSILDETREAELIRKNSSLIKDEILKEYYVSFLKNNMAVSKRFQERILSGSKIAFSGIKGAFANIAVDKIFEGSCAVPFPDFKSAYKAVEQGECDSVVLPLENSYNGDVGQVMDLTFFGNLYINGIYDIDVVQNLVAKKGATLSGIKEVISHPQALGQCDEFIKNHKFKMTECENTAIAAKYVSESEREDLAAIASLDAAEKYNLEVLASNINKSNKNTTRFAVFSRVMKKAENKDGRFIMLFTVKNEAGSLGKAISIIGENGFNLRAMKSRPTKELIWDYYFYVEGEGNINSQQGEKMLLQLKAVCSNLKVAGSFEKEITLM